VVFEWTKSANFQVTISIFLFENCIRVKILLRVQQIPLNPPLERGIWPFWRILQFSNRTQLDHNIFSPA